MAKNLKPATVVNSTNRDNTLVSNIMNEEKPSGNTEEFKKIVNKIDRYQYQTQLQNGHNNAKDSFRTDLNEIDKNFQITTDNSKNKVEMVN
eukprot:CAMPEP_0116940124 /NCGR_PEP_ID=MMETSP0467-20121206/33175_1 /TAXON_ID=283647 /ORGANISM="Mesodinium pulex, Strain SPMC105" /LENGTH=90 /DNA_ID=CAMNT_0004622595 /DNA_START=329 /DNA_END=601 /DNA_ORIENTATION=+